MVEAKLGRAQGLLVSTGVVSIPWSRRKLREAVDGSPKGGLGGRAPWGEQGFGRETMLKQVCGQSIGEWTSQPHLPPHLPLGSPSHPKTRGQRSCQGCSHTWARACLTSVPYCCEKHRDKHSVGDEKGLVCLFVKGRKVRAQTEVPGGTLLACLLSTAYAAGF